jgi:hypothetical protein
MQKFEQYYVALWCLTMPVTSFLLIPVVQGTIIPYMLGLGSFVFVLLRIKNGEVPLPVLGYFKMFAILAGLWLLLLCGSQFGDMLNSHIDIGSMYTISEGDNLMFRTSLFTQSIYLLACVMIALYFRYLLPEAWTRYVYWGAWFFVVYGLYDWFFYLVLGQSGDFIANRTFSGDHPGSWSQSLNFGGVSVLRLKSCLGEPSFVSVVAIPYLFLALEARKMKLTIALTVCAILSTSTTVILGLTFCVLLKALWSDRGRRASLAILLVLALAFVVLVVVFPDTYRFLFADKFSGDTDSGRERLQNIADYENLFSEFSIINWLFGIGFGYVYFSLMWSITANMGLIGIGTFLYAFLKPAYLLPRAAGSEALKVSMVAIVVVIAITLSELFTPTTWMFLGLAYRRLDQLKDQAALPVRRLPREEALTPALS